MVPNLDGYRLRRLFGPTAVHVWEPDAVDEAEETPLQRVKRYPLLQVVVGEVRVERLYIDGDEPTGHENKLGSGERSRRRSPRSRDIL